MDKLGCNLAIIEGVNEKNLGLSIMNRLIRACEYNIEWFLDKNVEKCWEY